MEHKALYIGGGVAALVIGLVVWKKHSSAAATTSDSSSNDSPLANSGYYYSGTVPSSTGYVSTSDNTPSNLGNSGTTDTSGGFSISDLLTQIAKSTSDNNAAQIKANAHTADAAILAGIAVPTNGSVTVSHTDNGTTVTTTGGAPADPVEAMLTAEYKSVFNRAPDAAGLAYWKDAVNKGTSVGAIDAAFKNSDEYKKAHS